MRRGFTLVEMLVVIGIIAILVGVSLGGYSAMTKSADRQRAQELVSNVATALTAIYNDKGYWPKKLTENGADKDAPLNEEAAYPLALGKYLSLNYDETSKKTVGLDKFGVIDPWAQAIVKRKGTGMAKSDVVSGKKDRVIHYAIDLDGDGIVNANVGGTPVNVRATAIAWCGGKDGVVDPYPYGGSGGSSGGKGSNKGSSSSGGKTDDVYSWTPGQTRDVQ